MNADIRTRRLEPEPVDERSEVARRDEASGSTGVRRAADEATGEPLERRCGVRPVDAKGEDAPATDEEGHVETSGEKGVVRQDEPTDPTLGDGRTLEALRWIPVAEVDEYLIDEIHEIRGDSDDDVAQLYRLAEHVRDLDQAPLVPVVLRPPYRRNWGIITPTFFDGTFSLLLRVASRKIEPEARMPTLDTGAVDGDERDPETYQTLDRESSSG